MYRLKLLNKSGESAASITDFIINRKNNTETWRVNESPRVVKAQREKYTKNKNIRWSYKERKDICKRK